MKRAYFLLLAMLLCCGLCACGEKSEEAASSAQMVLPASEPPAESSASVIVFPSVQQADQAQAAASEALPDETPQNDAASVAVDVDLTEMSSTMVYSEVYNMVVNDSDSYMGKTIKMQGMLATYDANPDPELNLGVDYFFAVVVEDATACCQQGLEFVWDGHDTPDDFPPDGTVITVTGVFDSYDVGGLPMYHIVASSVEVGE